MRLSRHLPFAVLLTLVTVSPVAAQSAASVRPFFLFSQQRFAASETFDAVFGGSSHPFIGGGAQVVIGTHVFADVTMSRFRKSGERVFHFDGESFPLGIPLTVSITPIEFTAGLRVPVGANGAIAPYVGGGFGSYKYKETADFAATGDDVALRRSGYLVVGGSEFRVHEWVILTADVQYTRVPDVPEVQYSRVPDVLGLGGVSEQTGESNLGGVSARFRVMIGR
jgi:opacity protein-like surface antigen